MTHTIDPNALAAIGSPDRDVLAAALGSYADRLAGGVARHLGAGTSTRVTEWSLVLLGDEHEPEDDEDFGDVAFVVNMTFSNPVLKGGTSVLRNTSSPEEWKGSHLPYILGGAA